MPTKCWGIVGWGVGAYHRLQDLKAHLSRGQPLHIFIRSRVDSGSLWKNVHLPRTVNSSESVMIINPGLTTRTCIVSGKRKILSHQLSLIKHRYFTTQNFDYQPWLFHPSWWKNEWLNFLSISSQPISVGWFNRQEFWLEGSSVSVSCLAFCKLS